MAQVKRKQLWKEKYGYITLMAIESHAHGTRSRSYSLRWQNPETKKDVKFRLDTTNRDEARTEARKQDAIITDQRAKLRLMPAAAVRHIATAPTIREAMEEAIRVRSKRKRLSPGHVYSLSRQKERFLDYMASNFPAVSQWKDVRCSPHVDSYVDHLTEKGLSPVSVRHYLEAPSLTGNYFSVQYEEFGYRPLRVTTVAPPVESTPKKNYLTAKQLERAIATAGEMQLPGAQLAFMIGGWCGLNLREIARLRATDLDFSTGMVTIRESKNKYRNRVIPVPAFVMQAIGEHMRNQTIPDVAGHLFLNAKGKPADNLTLSWPMHSVLHQLGLHPGRPRPERQRRKLERAGIAGPVQVELQPVHTGPTVTAKDCRKTFINLARAAGCDRETLRRYVGHTPSDVMSANYEDFSTDIFRVEVVAKVEQYRTNQLQAVTEEQEREAAL